MYSAKFKNNSRDAAEDGAAFYKVVTSIPISHLFSVSFVLKLMEARAVLPLVLNYSLKGKNIPPLAGRLEAVSSNRFSLKWISGNHFKTTAALWGGLKIHFA